jgi:hypothetical protein
MLLKLNLGSVESIELYVLKEEQENKEVVPTFFKQYINSITK